MTVSDTPADKVRVLTGLAGRGISQSRTPWMHEQEGDAQGLQLSYELFDFTARGWTDDHLPKLLDDVQAGGFAGINVTLPFKQAVIPHLDSLSESAGRIGAVNTVAFTGGRRIGHNTDVTGFGESLRAGLAGLDRSCVLQLGCGGAGAATAHALLGDGVERLLLSDVDVVRAADLTGHLNEIYGSGRAAVATDPAQAAALAVGLVNASPMGMDKFPGLPIAEAAIEPRHWVADIVYFPLETAFLRAARAKGCRALDGSGMAIRQAAAAFEIFTGLKPNLLRMTDSFAAFTAPGADRAA